VNAVSAFSDVEYPWNVHCERFPFRGHNT
jgi:hypothetical protein